MSATRWDMEQYPLYERTLVLGLGHRARQGKDLVARLLQEAFPGRVVRAAFGDALKAYCRVARGMTKKDTALLQQVGTNELRAQDPDIWVRALAWSVAELDADARERQIVVITDVRFENETDFVKAVGGRLCRLRRLNPDGTRFIATDRPADHPSETALDDYPWPHTIAAKTGDVDTLRREALRIVGDYLNTSL